METGWSQSTHNDCGATSGRRIYSTAHKQRLHSGGHLRSLPCKKRSGETPAGRNGPPSIRAGIDGRQAVCLRYRLPGLRIGRARRGMVGLSVSPARLRQQPLARGENWLQSCGAMGDGCQRRKPRGGASTRSTGGIEISRRSIGHGREPNQPGPRSRACRGIESGGRGSKNDFDQGRSGTGQRNATPVRGTRAGMAETRFHAIMKTNRMQQEERVAIFYMQSRYLMEPIVLNCASVGYLSAPRRR